MSLEPTPESPPVADPGQARPPRPWSKRIRRWVLEALLIGLVYWGFTGIQGRNLLSSGEPAPALSLHTKDGQLVSLADFRGKTVLLHFWATWCGVCVHELSMLKDFQNELEDDTVLLTVVADADNPKLSSFLTEHEINYPVLLGTRELVRRFNVSAFPTNYFIDRDGIIQGSSVGLTTRLGINSRLGCAR